MSRLKSTWVGARAAGSIFSAALAFPEKIREKNRPSTDAKKPAMLSVSRGLLRAGGYRVKFNVMTIFRLRANSTQLSKKVSAKKLTDTLVYTFPRRETDTLGLRRLKFGRLVGLPNS